MAEYPIQKFEDDIVDIKKQSLYARLKRLFSTDVIVRNIGGKQLKIKDTDNIMYATDRNSLRDRFNRIRATSYNAYSRDFALSYQAARMDLFRDYDTMDMDPILACLAPSTYVSTLEGNFTIEELCNKYPNGEHFEVWSWDKDKCQYTIGSAHHPRKTGTKKVIELWFDNNQCLKCTENHRILMVDGSYKQAKNLVPGDSVMPFLYKNSEYLKIKTRGRYKKAHQFIYEDIFEKNISNRAIHHINHNKYDNRTCNLRNMSIAEHALYHGKSIITTERKKNSWTDGRRKQHGLQVKNRFKNEEYRKMFSDVMKNTMSDVFLRKRISNKMKEVWKSDEYSKMALKGVTRWQSSEEGKKFMSEHASKLNKVRWNTSLEYREKMAKIFSNHAKTLWSTPGFKEKITSNRIENLRRKIANDPQYTKMVYGKHGDKNSNFNYDITNEYILTEGVKYKTLIEFANNVNISTCSSANKKAQFLTRRLRSCGYSSFRDYKKIYQYSNHKLVKIVDNGEITDVYDLTVDFFENFCLKSGIIVSNSALDIVSDECLTLNELKQMLVIHSKNSNIKNILHNLFYDILNIEGNMWSWTRNMLKYGDFYLRLSITPEYGIYMVEPISAYNVERIENCDPYNKRYVKFQIRPTDTSQAEIVENYEMSHFRLLSDSNFLPYGKCIKADSLINTDHGCKQIKDINIGDKILSFNIEKRIFEPVSVINKVNSGIKKLLNIKTQHNFIEASENHPILTFNTETKVFEYKESVNIKIGDLLVIDNNKHKKCKNIQIGKTFLDNKQQTCPVFIPETDLIPNIVDEEFAEFFGFMLGDGWAKEYTHGYRVCFALGTDEEQNKRYINILEKYAGKKCNITFHGEGKSRTAIVYSKRLYKILKNMGFGDTAKTKRIPDWVFESSSHIQMAVVIGFGNADGWSFIDQYDVKHYAIEICNENLIKDFKRLLQYNNIKSSNPRGSIYNDIIEICGNECNRSESWLLYYYLDSNSKKQLNKYKFIDTDEFILDPVRKIEDGGEDETWDIQVDSENSNFIANGIVVHNSYIEGARRVWKQLSLLEDAMMIHRIMRAPERRIFKIDVGAIPPNEVDAYMEKLMSKVKKVPYMDERTGDYNLRFNLQNMVEDFYLPVRGGDSGTEIDTLSGMEWTGIEDLDYIKHKMMAALKIPKAFLGYEEGLSGKASLASEDVRFARTIQRIQRILTSELSKIAIVHLYAQGYRDESLVDFELELTNPSTIFEREKVEIWSDKVAVATDMMEVKLFSKDWIYKNVFNMSDEDKMEVNDQVVEDTKQKFRLTSIEEEGNDPAKPAQQINSGDIGGGGPEGGPELGGLKGGGEGGLEGGPELGGLKGGEGGPESKGGGGAGGLKERTEPHHSDEDQTGRKDATKYPFGEDPRGDLEMKSNPGSEREIKHNFRDVLRETHRGIGVKPIIDKSMIKSLKDFLENPLITEEQELKNEPGGKSFLDERNIIELEQ